MTITFTEQINVSVAIGDLAWYVTPTTAGVPGNEYSVASASTALLVGEITDVTPYSITVDVAPLIFEIEATFKELSVICPVVY